METETSLTRYEIERISERFFTISEWIEKYGKPVYNLRGLKGVINNLQNGKMIRDWEIIKHGFRWYIFLSKPKNERMIDDETLNHATRSKLTPKQIEKIRKTDFTVKGVQRKLAIKLNVHESQISKVKRNLQRTTDVQGKQLRKPEKEKIGLDRTDVERFFGMMLTVKEFYREYGKQYDIKWLQDIYSMCANRENYSLPEGWHAVRVTGSWLIYRSE